MIWACIQAYIDASKVSPHTFVLTVIFGASLVSPHVELAITHAPPHKHLFVDGRMPVLNSLSTCAHFRSSLVYTEFYVLYVIITTRLHPQVKFLLTIMLLYYI